MRVIHVEEYYSAMKRSEAWTQATAWMNLETVQQKEPDVKGQTSVFPFTGNTQNLETHRQNADRWGEVPGAGGGAGSEC